MLAKCANPSCSRSFRYLHEGKLYRMEMCEPNEQGSSRHSEWFWLCAECATKVILTKVGGEVVAVSLPRESELHTRLSN
jgi:hypothetical protein